MWGNDPGITGDEYTNPTPTETRINPNLKESVINPDPKELPPTHLGWNGRLNGPVDNPRSSCMSCHMTAEIPALSPITPFFQANPPPMGSPEWMRWFPNNKCGTPFDKGTKSADFSLTHGSWRCPAVGADRAITTCKLPRDWARTRCWESPLASPNSPPRWMQ